MESLRKLIVSIFAIFIAILTTILVMIKGWGLKPQSWWWIIGVYIIGHFISLLMAETVKH